MEELLKFNLANYGPEALSAISEALDSNRTSGNGPFTQKVHAFFKKTFGMEVLMTHSCTAALEMMALLLDLKEGDEVIVPSYTFVTSATAFELFGAQLVFADSDETFPNISLEKIQERVTPRTKAVCVVHYGGSAFELERIKDWLDGQGILFLEDAAQAFGVHFQSRDGLQIPLGKWGCASSMSFHETKNIACGQGGLISVQKEEWKGRAAVLWEKGTNRKEFFEGKVDKYGWVDKGSSFLASDITAALLHTQLEKSHMIQAHRMKIWGLYNEACSMFHQGGRVHCMQIPEGSGHNAHMYYLVLDGAEERRQFMQFLLKNGIQSTFHYQSLHKSQYVLDTMGAQPPCPNSDRFSDGLVRLPLHSRLTLLDAERIADALIRFFR